jgi:hypothetical protein
MDRSGRYSVFFSEMSVHATSNWAWQYWTDLLYLLAVDITRDFGVHFVTVQLLKPMKLIQSRALRAKRTRLRSWLCSTIYVAADVEVKRK